jgi:hypothetical protein
MFGYAKRWNSFFIINNINSTEIYPMKCVLNKQTKVIERTDDEKAAALVKAKTHVWASKIDWKRQKAADAQS